MNTPYWYEKPNILLSNLSSFFPHKDMSMAQKMNSFVRLALYFFILSSVAAGRASHSGTYVLLGTLASTYIIGARNPVVHPNVIIDPTNTPIVTSKSDVQSGSSGAATPFTEKSQIPEEALKPPLREVFFRLCSNPGTGVSSLRRPDGEFSS